MSLYAVEVRLVLQIVAGACLSSEYIAIAYTLAHKKKTHV